MKITRQVIFSLMLVCTTFGGAAGLHAAAPAGSLKIKAATDPMPTGPIDYINPDAPEVKPPKLRGKYYDALVPATLDLADRARMAINYMTESLNPNADYEAWDIAEQMADPPTFIIMNPLTTPGKYFETVPLMRMICGSRQNIDIEHFLMGKFMKMQGPDGHIYVPTAGRDWVHHSWIKLFPKGFDGEHISVLGYGTSRFLPAFLIYEQTNGKKPWHRAARQLADGFKKIYIEDNDAAYMYAHYTTPGSEIKPPDEKPVGIDGVGGVWIANSLVQYHRRHNDPDALRIAGKMIRYAMGRMNYFADDGRFEPDDNSGGNPWAHFHAHTTAMIAAMDIVRETGDKDLLERVRKAYEYGITVGNGVVGFFPEATHESGRRFMSHEHPYKYHTSENCEVADMIRVGVMLGRMGVKKSDGSDPWDDVDRWTRNQFAENQTTSINWMTDGHLDYSDSPITQGHHDTFYKPGRPPFFGCYTTENVAPRTLGAFASHPSANDYIGHPEFIVSAAACCTGNGSRAIFHIWRDTLTWDDGTLRINLLLNRASKWADVNSYIPYTGRVDIRIKKKMSLQIRIPEWVSPDDARCRVDGKDRELNFEDRYANVGKVRKGEEIVFTFPISERTKKVMIQGPPGGENEYTLVIRGNSVVNIDPPGKYSPLYLRGHYRTGQTLWKKVERFVTDENLDWW
jgi:hypothetical protein